MWGKLDDMMNNIKGLSLNKALFIAFSRKDIQEYLIELNTEGQPSSQLWQGIDSTGRDLRDIGGDYSPFTKQKKAFDGLPFDRVTLFDEGDFYESWKVEVNKNNIILSANSIKDGEDLAIRWGNDIIGLTDENIENIVHEIAGLVVNYAVFQILR